MTRSGRPSASLRILQITDFHLLSDPQSTMLGINTEESLEAVLARVADFDFRPDIYLLTGDLVQDAEPATYRRLKDLLLKLPAPVYCLPGNHDEPVLMREILADDGRIFVEAHIALDGWDVICLNSTIPHQPCGYLPETELALLDERLEAIAPDRYVLISMHHPPMALASRWLDTMMVGNADALWARVEKYPNVRGLIIGHVHQALDDVIRGVRVLASPSTCFQFKPRNDDFAIDAVPQGFRWIQLDSDGTISSGVERVSGVPNGLDLDSIGY